MLVVHELAHQWFGDYITCGSWADIWINEGFATYCEGLYLEYTYGANEFKNWRTTEISQITSQTGGSVYCTDTASVDAIFNGRLSYAKGGEVLHMLRKQIGDEPFFQGIKNYLNDPVLANHFAKTQDFMAHMELAADSTLTEFFNDWIYGQGYPKYKITWQAVDEIAWVRIEQTQSHPSVSFFEMKIPVRFSSTTKDTIVWFHNTQNNQLLNVNIGFNATQAAFDPNKEITTKYSTIAKGQLVSVDENFSGFVSVYPNPSVNSEVKVNSEKEIKEIQVFTIVGNKVRSINNPGVQAEFNLTNGVYIVKVELIDGSIETVKVVVKD
jgi:aminopeptidase N